MHVLAEPLVHSYNESMRSGSPSDDWKFDHVSAIREGGHMDHLNYYRPVNLTSVLMKVFGKIVRDDIYEHFSSRGSLCSQEHGFVCRRSRLTNFLCMLDEVTRRLDKGVTIEVCYMDFREAFASVNHRLLKLKLYRANI